MKSLARPLALLAAILVLAGAGCERSDRATPNTAPPPAAATGSPAAPPPSPPADGAPVIVALGDSLTAGQGLPESDAYPAVLERRLREAGYPHRVVNAGVSGETSSGALARVEWILRLGPSIVIVETGANDGLRGIDPRLVEKNLDALVERLLKADVVVILAGMRMVTNLGRDYTETFAGIYPAVARRHGVALIPFFLEGVAAEPRLNQDDGIHPTAEGYRVIVERILPVIRDAISRVGRP